MAKRDIFDRIYRNVKKNESGNCCVDILVLCCFAIIVAICLVFIIGLTGASVVIGAQLEFQNGYSYISLDKDGNVCSHATFDANGNVCSYAIYDETRDECSTEKASHFVDAMLWHKASGHACGEIYPTNTSNQRQKNVIKFK